MADNFLTEPLPLAVLEFIGADAEKFLQGQLTCDLTEVTETQAAPGALCSPKGRVKATFILARKSAEHFYMIMPKGHIEFVQSALQPYSAFFKAQMQTNELVITGKFLTTSPAHGLFSSASLADSMTINLPAVTATQLNTHLPEYQARQLIISEQAPDSVEHDSSNKLIPAIDWQISDCLAGLIFISSDNCEQFVPHDLSLPRLGAVSFTKGCYTGQEIVARMHYRGNPKYQLALIITEPTELSFSAKLSQSINPEQSQKIGQVVDQINLIDNRKLIVAVVKKELLETPQITLLSDGTSVESEFIVPPMLVEETQD
jgi:tRNA-modifying protein YgfZ